MKYFRKLEGDRIYLSPLNTEDAETYTRWLSDLEVSKRLGNAAQVISLDGEKKWISSNMNGHQFAIIRSEDDQLLGNCGFNCLDPLHQAAEIGIFIGEKENRGKGYGSEAIRLLLKYGFQFLNLENIMLFAFSFNESALACYRKIGFKEIGRRRKAYFAMGEFHDIVYMDILREEFQTEC